MKGTKEARNRPLRRRELIGHSRIKFQCKAGIKQNREDGSETFSLISYFILLLKLYDEEIILTLTFTNHLRLCKHLRKD